MYRTKLHSAHFKWLCIAGVVLACGCSQSNDKFKNAKEPSTADAGTDGTSSADGDQIIDPTLASTQEELIEAECSLLYRCCSPTELEDRFGIDGDEAECTDFQSAVPTSIHLANLTTSIEQGRITFDAGMAELCAESYLAQDCSEWTMLSPARTRLPGCIEMIIPEVEEGGRCKQNYECTTEVCEYEQPGDEFGTCVTRAAENEPCFDAQCATGLYCDVFDDKCIPQKQDGQACLDDEECLSGACSSDANGDRFCSPPAPLCISGLDEE